jgi:outer membrane protein TolC
MSEMKTKCVLYVAFVLLLANSGRATAQKVFTSFDSLMGYAARKNIALQLGAIKVRQAQQAKLAAALNIPEVSGGASFSYTNNTRLPVNVFPADAFGGQPGTFREVQTGVQYVTNLNQNLDVKLLNLKGWEGLTLAKLNIAVTNSDQQLTLKTLYDNLAATYFNIVSLQEQYMATVQNVQAAETLLAIVQQKYKQGLVKQQDVNDAKVSQLNLAATAQQIQWSIEQQYLALKIQCDMPVTDSIKIVQPIVVVAAKPAVVSQLAIYNSQLKEKMAFSTYKQNKYALYPTLSFFQSATTQQLNTSSKWFDNRVRWIPSSYIGLRLNIPIPSANAVAQVSKAKYDYQMAQKSTEQQQIKAQLEARQLTVALDKAAAQTAANVELFDLQRDTYQKNQQLYQAGLLSLDQTLTSFNAMVNGHYNWIAAQVNQLLAQAKIDINNNIR